LNIINAIQVNDDLTPSYRLTKILTENLPPMLRSTADYTKSLIGIAAGISKPNAFGNYFYDEDEKFLSCKRCDV
jgi:hypothetical protein